MKIDRIKQDQRLEEREDDMTLRNADDDMGIQIGWFGAIAEQQHLIAVTLLHRRESLGTTNEAKRERQPERSQQTNNHGKTVDGRPSTVESKSEVFASVLAESDWRQRLRGGHPQRRLGPSTVDQRLISLPNTFAGRS